MWMERFGIAPGLCVNLPQKDSGAVVVRYWIPSVPSEGSIVSLPRFEDPTVRNFCSTPSTFSMLRFADVDFRQPKY